MIKIIIYFLLDISMTLSIENNATLSKENFKCSVPDVSSQDENLDISRFKSDFSKISEVKFPGIIGPLKEKIICKIKCIDGNWVGPLCSSTSDGRFHPILRECVYRNSHPMLAISFKNSSIEQETHFPHGSVIMARCRHFGLYKIKGDSTLRCENGEWAPKFPECVPTTIVTNFTGDAPPSILYTVVTGSAVVDPSGELLVFPDSTLRLDCVSLRALGDPHWSWTQALGPHTAEWSPDDGEKDTHYILTLRKMSARHSGQYTCTASQGHTQTVLIKVVNIVCQPISSSGRVRQFAQGSRLGHSVHFSCPLGFHLNGSSVLTCMGEGSWSGTPPRCEETQCPALSAGAPLVLVEYNASVGGRAVFSCGWGYRLSGAPGLECGHDGTWSGTIPHCTPIYCPVPLVPKNGRLLTSATSKMGKYPVGDLLMYECEQGFRMTGESSIVCTENGFWSQPPPFCLPPSKITKTDTIYLENTTFVFADEQ